MSRNFYMQARNGNSAFPAGSISSRKKKKRERLTEEQAEQMQRRKYGSERESFAECLAYRRGEICLILLEKIR